MLFEKGIKMGNYSIVSKSFLTNYKKLKRALKSEIYRSFSPKKKKKMTDLKTNFTKFEISRIFYSRYKWDFR